MGGMEGLGGMLMSGGMGGKSKGGTTSPRIESDSSDSEESAPPN